jgi:hypothetical protein
MHIHPGSQDKYTYLSGKTDGYQTNERHSGGKTHYELCQRLVGTGKYEEASFAIVLTARIEEFHTPETFHHIARWFEVGIRNWAHTDVLCGLVLGPFLKKGVVALEAFLPWRESQWKYQRRAVPVATIEILDSQPGAARLLAFVEPLMMDGEKVVPAPHLPVRHRKDDPGRQSPLPPLALTRAAIHSSNFNSRADRSWPVLCASTPYKHSVISICA